MTTLAIIIVSWNTRKLLGRCLETVQASLSHTNITPTIIVVDNASTDGTPAMLRTEHPKVCLIESGRNLGFAGGNNLALRRVLSGQQTPDYVLLLNPDTEVLADALPQLVQYLEAHPDVAVVGPQLRYPDGSIQSSRRRFPQRMTFFMESTPLEQYWPNNPWVRHYRCDDTPHTDQQHVDWLVGAALLVRRSAILQAGILDDRFLMYSEELEWQQRMRRAQAGYIAYMPTAVIVHHEGKSSEQAIARRYINFQQSRLRHARMMYGQRFATMLRLFLQVAYGGELLVEASKWLLGHKRSLRAQRVEVYWQVIRALGST
ncbi:MAG: glycosyltransferase family 2 protein [Chloroflexota bacterium]